MTPSQRRAFTAFNESKLEWELRKKLLKYAVGTSYFKEMDEFQCQSAIKILANPVQAFAEWGRETGKCMVCNRTLTDPESVQRGIGPECSSKIKG